MFGLGATELLIILLIGLLFFGAKRLPEIGRALGRARREFGQSSQGESAAKAPDQAGAPGKSSAPEDGGLEAEIKDQLLSRVPGLGRINRLKKTLDKAGRVVDSLDKKS